MPLESKFKENLIQHLEIQFPESLVLKLDPTYNKSIPDLLLLQKRFWAALEVKRSGDAPRRPNQEYYVDLMDNMSFASFVFPENEWEVIHEIEKVISMGHR